MVHRLLWIGAVVLAAALTGCGSQAGLSVPPVVARHAPTDNRTAPPRATSPAQRPTSPPGASALPSDGDEPHAATAQVSAARTVARAFFSSYVAYLYGRLPARRVAGANRCLRWQLEHGHAIITPTERASRPRIAHLSLASTGPPISVVAVAVIDVDHGQPSRLTATLELDRRTWLVVAIAG